MDLISAAYPDFRVLSGYFDGNILALRISSRERGQSCPDCGCWSGRLHSSYYRTAQDLPLYGATVLLRVFTRKFFCDNRECPRRVFSERFKDFLETSQVRTVRLNNFLMLVGSSLGGNPGSMFCRSLGISTSRDTILRRIQTSPLVEKNGATIIGIDDWAYCKGQRYGTIICDLERHSVVDLLPDRSISTVANWLRMHPEIQIVSRDRAGAYAEAIRRGLPNAMQVADRWHVLKNSGGRCAAISHLPPRQLPERQNISEPKDHEPRPLTVKEKEQNLRRENKWQRVQHVQQLHATGVSIRGIARTTGLSRQTIRTYLTWTEIPKANRTGRKTLLDPYRNQVLNLLDEGLKGPDILKVIREAGYNGSRSTLSQYVAELRRSVQTLRPTQAMGPTVRTCHVSPRRAAKVLTQSDDELGDEDRRYLAQLLEKVEGAEQTRNLCLVFLKLMDEKNSRGLNDWLNETLNCHVKELRSFAKGIQRDYHAVAAGLVQPWSNGQVEGQVNRLKTIKRQMYGRANFHLLRARVLYRV